MKDPFKTQDRPKSSVEQSSQLHWDLLRFSMEAELCGTGTCWLSRRIKAEHSQWCEKTVSTLSVSSLSSYLQPDSLHNSTQTIEYNRLNTKISLTITYGACVRAYLSTWSAPTQRSEEASDPWTWRYRWLRATILVLETEPGSSPRAANAPNCRAISPALRIQVSSRH